MSTEAMNTIMKERIWISRVVNEIVFQPLRLDAGTPLHDERVVVETSTSAHVELQWRR